MEQGQASIANFVDSSIDQIVDWASIGPEKVLEEFHARKVKRADGRPLTTIEDLQHVKLGDANTVARGFIKSYSQMAAGQGFVTGLGGMITLPASVPTDIAAYLGWLARTASAVQLCYGFEHRTETADAQLKIAMLAGSGVSTLTLQGTEILVTQLGRRVMITPYAQAPIQAVVRALARRVGITLTHKSFARAVPVVGGVVNGSVQGGLVYAGGNRIHAYYREIATSQPTVSDPDEIPSPTS